MSDTEAEILTHLIEPRLMSAIAIFRQALQWLNSMWQKMRIHSVGTDRLQRFGATR
jgi:hypothetical protein